ncbi:transglutaminase-like cysteine peptidase [Simiduia sp. 21SJ11W-1]|uniref:transglutaminase-like cysteine peptidase n=1 Tax=Simiduia sp. 21SJ11W-1 TaxID=2909669 RepID=UPI00209FE467|nr:transglutaminase-like cysteine peptidase [Simiduia sp. 21SJ11W-1]UTA47679.1 transglutaminase-like cysteine peptidase [Simiduia sp. 21SJ11W-1]
MNKLGLWVLLIVALQGISEFKRARTADAQQASRLQEDRAYAEGIAKLKQQDTHQGPRPGRIELVMNGALFDESQLHTILGRDNSRSAFFSYKLHGVEFATASAMGLDLRHHFVNAYLEGYSPFVASNVFVPLSVLARRKTYMLDKLNHGGEEVWQTSRQAYLYTRGDCEDHAIALADWLIDMGEDARVALGTYDGGGHAWVVLIKDGQEYILEATQKSGLAGLKRYPLAAMQPKYQPQFQFNRTSFWYNVGSPATTRYRSQAWLEKSRFSAQ